MIPNALVTWLAAGSFLFAGITAMSVHPDPVFKWLAGPLLILMCLHALLRLRLESGDPVRPRAHWQLRLASTLTVVTCAGWLALTLLKQIYGPAVFFLGGLVFFALR